MALRRKQAARPTEYRIMIDKTFDPSTLLNAARDAYAPVLKAQQEGFKSLERLARLQYAVAGDVRDPGQARPVRHRDRRQGSARTESSLISSRYPAPGGLCLRVRLFL